jgi:ComF family protein
MVYNWIKIVQKVWQQPCLLCHAHTVNSNGLCAACRTALPSNHQCCRICALPLPATSTQKVRCGACQRRIPRFDGVFAPFLYEHPVSDLIVALKYHHRLAAGRVLGQLLTEHITRHTDALPDCVIPVPLHAHRLRERGFNQASELARAVTRDLELPLSLGSLHRIKETPAQAGLKRSLRLRNLADAFEYHDQTPPEHVAIVDDVVTTGATAEALARVLKRAGVAKVDIWAVARTPKL